MDKQTFAQQVAAAYAAETGSTTHTCEDWHGTCFVDEDNYGWPTLAMPNGCVVDFVKSDGDQILVQVTATDGTCYEDFAPLDAATAISIVRQLVADAE